MQYILFLLLQITLFYLVVPKKLPNNGAKYILAFAHAIVFTVLYQILHENFAYQEGFTSEDVKGHCIFAELISGLGNRLFIYAAALLVKNKILQKYKINLPICLVNTGNKHSKVDYASELFKQGITYTGADIAARREKAHKPYSNKEFNEHNPQFNYKNTPVTYKNSDISLPLAYYQNYEAMKSVIPIIRGEVIPALEGRYPDLKDDFNSKSYKSVFMHVRRGDYIEHAASLPAKYYKDGLNIIQKDIDIKYLYVLSDDVGWCKEQSWNTFDLHVIWIDNKDELYCLYLMSLCLGGAIISGSTFSLWGVFLGAYNNRSARIIYPSKWYTGDASRLNLPDSWTKIQIN